MIHRLFRLHTTRHSTVLLRSAAATGAPSFSQIITEPTTLVPRISSASAPSASATSSHLLPHTCRVYRTSFHHQRHSHTRITHWIQAKFKQMSASASTSSSSDIDITSLLAPESRRRVIGPSNIWRTHGTKGVFVPPTVKGQKNAENAAASSTTSSSLSTPAPAAQPLPPTPLDHSLFLEDVTLIALHIETKKCGVYQQWLRKHANGGGASATASSSSSSSSSSTTSPQQSPFLYSRSRISSIMDDPSSKEKKYLLTSARTMDEFGKMCTKEIYDLIKKEGGELVEYTFQLTYDYFPLDTILQKLLPPSITIPHGFETVGHIAHLNLSEAQRPYGKVIAQVILDKNPHLHTVINKVGAISNEFRVFSMEILGGINSYLTEVKEHGCNFIFDFSTVYWNSRLSTEHSRMIHSFKREDLIVDLMCGIGPFVVPTGKKFMISGEKSKRFKSGVQSILGNDLNPDSYKWLVQNISSNKLTDYVKPFNMDARAFLWHVRDMQLDEKSPYYKQKIDHILMNLPASAPEFLDAFVGLYTITDDMTEAQKDACRALIDSPPLVHVYCFSRLVDTPIDDLLPRFRTAVGERELPPGKVVRDLESHANVKKGKEERKERLKEEKRKKEMKVKGVKEQKNEEDKDESMNVETPMAAASSAASSTTATSSSSSSSSSTSSSLYSRDFTSIRFVRNVAPHKDMFCVSLYPPTQILQATPTWREKPQEEKSVNGSGTTIAEEESKMDETADPRPGTSSVAGKRKMLEEEDKVEEVPPTKKSK